MRVHLIACGVLAMDVRALATRQGLDLSMEFLPGGLHERPHDLRRRLQEAIDEASAKRQADRIAVGYGVCGLGTVGIHARALPLAIPKVHDCIALFLGSDAAYREQFAKFPGTYYVSSGWVAEKTEPCSQSARGQPKRDTPQPDFDELVEKYGHENSEAIRHFLNSWQRNYQRAVFIDTGAEGKQACARIARGMAEDFGWKYEELPGTPDILAGLLTAEHTTDQILIVPPDHITTYDAINRAMKARPIRATEESEPAGSRTLVVESEPDTPSDEQPLPSVDLGLGIDAGGTYTDAVLYDFAADRVIQKAKALTTRWDFAVGIGQALDQLDPSLLPRVDLASISTTLATNAIVEAGGQEVGLILMPPYGRYDAAAFKHRPLAVVDGQLEIDGHELLPPDPTQVRRVVRELLDRERVGAFAVTGYASHINPTHELLVKQAILEETDLTVTCGHELSEAPNYRIRAETAALNARIIPSLKGLLEKVRVSLDRKGICATTMVVRSDGSLMSLNTAVAKPIETILSGPAASVAGARHLASACNALVVDIGGTTTDTASITDGVVRTCHDGASVGGWRTHVQALDIRTSGLGGDSQITWQGGRFAIGPRRVAPLSWLVRQHAEGLRALDWLECHADDFSASSEGSDVLMLNDTRPEAQLSEMENRVVEALADGPLCVRELAERVGSLRWQFLPLRRLEEHFLVQRAGLTPTDLLHTVGELTLWDRSAAERACRLFAGLARLDPTQLATQLLDQFVRQLALELLKRQLADELDVEDLERSTAAMQLIDNALRPSGHGLEIAFTLHTPVVGIGAPAHYFLPKAVELLNGKAIVPGNADVANAIGAITSSVFVHKQVTISTNETGQYIVAGLPDAPTFPTFADAEDFAMDALQSTVRHMARESGTRETRIEMVIDDQVTTLADGGDLFLSRTIEARLSGRPDILPAPAPAQV